MLLLAVMLMVAQSDLPDRSADDIERSAVAARRAIEKSSVTWETKILFSKIEPEQPIITRKLWRDGDQLRIQLTKTIRGATCIRRSKASLAPKRERH
jgi:hypothetical protein